MDPKIIAAIVSAIVSIIVVILSFSLRSIFDRYFHLFKLESEHKYEQRKQIKNILSKNKIHLINAAETLNHRLWNFSNNYEKKWHTIRDYYTDVEKQNYFISFVYRFIAFFAWQKKLDNEMIFLDTTIASDDDLVMIKYFKLFQQIMCDTRLFESYSYDISKANDHFFNNNFEEMISMFIKDRDDRIVQYAHFKEEINEYIPTIEPIMNFINGISPDEERFRWEKLQILHICLLAFLNKYGYDYQYTSSTKLIILAKKYSKNRLLSNFKKIVSEYKLEKQNELKETIEIFEKYA
jgi:hypothetical protein